MGDNISSDNIRIEAVGITKSYGPPLFAPVSFTLRGGDGLGLEGCNGSGKTTLLDIISGLCRPDAGQMRTHGTIGYVMQQDGLSGLLSCRDNLLFEAALCRLPSSEARSRIRDLAEQCAISSFLDKRLSRCSAGMRQRVNLAAALLCRPGILLLDEAFSPLDSGSRAIVRNIIASCMDGGAAAVIVSHDRSDLDALCSSAISLPDSSQRDIARRSLP